MKRKEAPGQRTLAAAWGLTPPPPPKRSAAAEVLLPPPLLCDATEAQQPRADAQDGAAAPHRGGAAAASAEAAARVTPADGAACDSSPLPLAADAALAREAPLPAPPAAPPAPSPGLNDYERQREARIARNRTVMASLGIQEVRSALAPLPAARPARVPRQHPREALPARAYPLRSCGAAAAAGAGAGDVDAGAAALSDDEAEVSFDDSSVRRYACAEGCSFGAARGTPGAATSAAAPPAGFARVAGATFADVALTRTYALDRAGPLLAAAGHGGRAALWSAAAPRGSDAASGDASGDENLHDDVAAAAQATPPLLSWRAHAGWVSAALLLRAAHGALRLLTASNDASVAIWDLEKAHAGAPRRLAVCDALHRGGVWGAHLAHDDVAAAGSSGLTLWTASKDGTTRMSAVSASGVTPGRVFSGHHRGVVRAVRAARHGSGAVAADGGADGCVCVLDARAAADVALRLEGAHGGGAVNCLEWHPSAGDCWRLLSAGADPVARLWDLRRPDAPALQLRGHVAASAQQQRRLRHVYRPAFVARGAAVASPGEGSDALSLYCASTGRALSRGALGGGWGDPSVAFCHGADVACDDGAAPLLLARGGEVRTYAPFWDAAEEEPAHAALLPC